MTASCVSLSSLIYRLHDVDAVENPYTEKPLAAGDCVAARSRADAEDGAGNPNDLERSGCPQKKI